MSKASKVKPALTINYDSTKDAQIVMLAHTVDHGKLDIVSVPLADFLALADRRIKSTEEMHERVGATIKARKRIIYQHKHES